jgi:hypothetical protein
MLVTWTSTPGYRCEVRYHAYLPPPISIIVQSASRPSFIKPPSLPLLPAKLLNKDFYRLCSVVVTCNDSEASVRRLRSCMAKRTRILDHFSYMRSMLRSRLTPVEEPHQMACHQALDPTVGSEVRRPVTQAGFAVEPTAPSSSHRIGPSERRRRDIGNSIRARFLVPHWPFVS